jgi:hypothetical protein
MSGELPRVRSIEPRCLGSATARLDGHDIKEGTVMWVVIYIVVLVLTLAFGSYFFLVKP